MESPRWLKLRWLVACLALTAAGVLAADTSQDGKPVVVEDYAKSDAVKLGGDHLDPASKLNVGPVAPFAQAVQIHFCFTPGGGPSCGVKFASNLILQGPLKRLLIPIKGDAAHLAIRANLLDAHNELHMFTCVPAQADTTPAGFRWIAVDFTKPPLFVAGGDGDKVLQWPARLDSLFIDGNGNTGAEGDLVVGPISAVPAADATKAAAPLPTKPYLLQRCERLVADAGTWGDKAQPAASLALDLTQKHEGNASLRLDYHFAAVNTGQSAWVPVGERLPAGTARIRAALRSDGHARQVFATLIDANGAFTTVTFGSVAADTWQVLSADLAGRTFAWPVQWRDIAVSREAGKPDQGRLWVDAIGADLPDAPGDRLKASLDFGRWPPLCWGKDDAPHAELVVDCGAEEAAALPVSAKLYDHQRRLLADLFSGTASAKAGASFRQPLALKLPGFGVYEVEVKLGEHTSLHSFSWLPQRSPQWAEGPFGANATPLWLLDAMAGIGVAWTRSEYGWRMVEHRTGTYEDGLFAGPQAAVAAAGMHSLLLIGDWGPQQCQGRGKSPDNPETIAAYGRYCAWMTTANHSPLTQHFQIWNEPNLAGFWWPKPDVGNYAESLKSAYTAIKAADPQAQVVGVNMSCIDLPFLEELLKRGCAKSMDVVGLHPYHLPEAPERFKRAVPSPALGGEFPPGTFLQQMTRLTELLDRYGAGNLKLWLDEYGYPDRPDLYPDFAHDEWRAAALMVRQSLLALSIPRVERLFPYNVRDVATGDAGNWDNATGFVRSDGSPKARFASWATLTRMLHQRRFARTLNVGADSFTYEFTGKDGPVLALWCVSGAKTLAFKGKGNAPSITDSMGNTSTLTARDGQVIVGISEEPVYLAGWSDAEAVAGAPAIQGDLRCAPGETAEVTVPNARGTWTLVAPPGWSQKNLEAGRFALTPAADAVTGAVPLLFSGDGNTLGATLTYDDALRLSVYPGREGAVVEIDNPYARLRKVEFTARRDGATLPVVHAAAAPHATTPITLPLNCESDAGFTTIPLDISAALAEGEARSPVIIAQGRHTVVGFTPCPALVNGAPTGKPCLLDKPHQKVFLKQGSKFDAADQSGSFRAGWDAHRLHLEVAITDDQHRPQTDAANLWKGDSLQFDLTVAGVRHEFDVAIPAAGGGALTYRRSPTEGPAPELSASGTRNGTLTTYSVDIPWSLIGVTKPETTAIGFALLVNDDDGAGRTGWLEWFDGVGMSKDPSRYGPLVITK